VEARPFRLSIGLSGEARDTAARVADVARRRRDDPEDTDRRLARLGVLAEEGAEAVRAGRDLGVLFNAAQAELRALGLSTPTIDRMCEAALAAGSSGAKLTGAGGGGAVIATGWTFEYRVELPIPGSRPIVTRRSGA
jgi:mevalonate kinase